MNEITEQEAPKQRQGNEHVTACLVVQNGKWGAYIITPSMLEEKIAPVYITGHERVTQVIEAIRKECLEWKFEDFTDFGNFWQIVTEAGIAKPNVMPHRVK